MQKLVLNAADKPWNCRKQVGLIKWNDFNYLFSAQVVHEIDLLIKQKYLKLSFQPRGSLK